MAQFKRLCVAYMLFEEYWQRHFTVIPLKNAGTVRKSLTTEFDLKATICQNIPRHLKSVLRPVIILFPKPETIN